jgi:hypothetical protein
MDDYIEKIGASTLQHGKHNDRIYLMKLAKNDFPDIIATLDEMCRINEYGKIIGKIPAHYSGEFLANGYTIEAHVPGFFGGCEPGLFIAKYFSKIRQKAPQNESPEILPIAQPNPVPSKV